MKKLVLGAAALAGCVVAAVPASAQMAFADGRVKLDLRGYFTGGIAYADVDQAPGSTDEFENVLFGSDSEVHVSGKTVLDSGLEVGFKAEFELERDTGSGTNADTNDNEDDFVDEAYLQVSGGFGRMQFGQQDGVADQMIFSAPNVFAEFTISSIDMDPTETQFDFYAFGTSTGSAAARGADGSTGNFRNLIDTSPDFSDDVMKLIYFTPRIAGLQIGVSYAPIYGKNGQGFRFNPTSGVNPTPTNILDDSFGNNFMEIAANYVHEFGKSGKTRAKVSASYGRGDSGSALEDPTEWHVGAQVEFPGFQKDHKVTIGGAYKRANVSGAQIDVDETEVMDAGITYEMDDWTFGIAVSSTDGMIDGREAARLQSSAIGVELDQQAIIGGVTKKFGPGMEIGIGAMYFQDESRTLNQSSTSQTISGTAFAPGDTISQGAKVDAFAIFTEFSVNF